MALRRSSVLAAVALTVTLLAGASVAAAPASSTTTGPAAPGLTLPELPGPYPVGTVATELVDHSRADPWAGDGSPRDLMVTFWYPSRGSGGQPAQYMPPATRQRHEQTIGLQPGELRVLPQARSHAPVRHTPGGWPVLIFSPGLGGTRTLYAAIAENLASLGYVVVTVDHPYDGEIVEYPDGRVVLMLPEFWLHIEELFDARIPDITFLLDQLTLINRGRLVPRLRGALDLDRIGMFGHSFGGAAAAQAMLVDSRIDAGANVDGLMYGSVVQQGLDRPFLLIGRWDHNRVNDATWAQFWAQQRGWKRHLEVGAGVGHMAFSDASLLATRWDLSRRWPPDLMGALDGYRVSQIETAYLAAFFSQTLHGRPEPLLDRPSPDFPEVSFPT